jgi:two-component system, OmpR family, response regulator VicR
MKILVCEDDTMTLKALEHKLKQEGYTIVTATDGKQAENILTNDHSIDMLLTDLHMPFVSGLELIELVRSKLKKNIPIVMLTRVGLEDIVLQAFELGADDYVTKPFSPEDLGLRIKRLIIRSNKG